MKFELKDFQVTATKALLDRMLKARDAYYRDGDPTSCCLASPTGSGKTIMVAAAVEAIFNGNPEWGIERDPFATVLWVSDSPSLNEQTIYKFREATDLDPTLIETIENTFTGDHDELEPGHIYFLNRQKLSSAGLLTKGGEIPTFWQLLRRTVNDSSVHLYMLYDEAHKGLGSADKKDTAGETMLRAGGLFFISVPSFFLAILCMLLFSEEWRLLPSGGYGSMIQMIMPSFVLAAGTSAAVMRLQQTSMTEVAGKEFITTERAKGLPMPFIMKRHVLPNALVPVITMLGTFFGAILGGSVIIEDMFSIPGLGSYVLAAIWGRDYPVIQGYVIVSGTVFLTFNYLVDILCGMLNPSVRKGGAL